MKEAHTYRIKGNKWDKIQKIAWKLSSEAERIIKPTDVVNAILHKSLKNNDLKIKDIEEAKREEN